MYSSSTISAAYFCYFAVLVFFKNWWFCWFIWGHKFSSTGNLDKLQHVKFTVPYALNDDADCKDLACCKSWLDILANSFLLERDLHFGLRGGCAFLSCSLRFTQRSPFFLSGPWCSCQCSHCRCSNWLRELPCRYDTFYLSTRQLFYEHLTNSSTDSPNPPLILICTPSNLSINPKISQEDSLMGAGRSLLFF